jgi:hypothetical protein
MSFPFYSLLWTLLIKAIINRYEWLEDHSPFIVALSVMMTLTERDIYLSPSSFKLSHV